jgi:hypothetical protein
MQRLAVCSIQRPQLGSIRCDLDSGLCPMKQSRTNALTVCLMINASALAALPCQSPSITKEQFPPAMVPDKVPPTARSIQPFLKLKSGMSMRQLVERCGLPDADIGSGIHIYVYRLSDRSQIRVGTPNSRDVMYVTRVMQDGKEQKIIKDGKWQKGAFLL